MVGFNIGVSCMIITYIFMYMLLCISVNHLEQHLSARKMGYKYNK